MGGGRSGTRDVPRGASEAGVTSRKPASTGAGKADARNAALTSVVRNGGNSTAVLTDIAKNSKNPVFKLVAKAILAKGLPFDLRIRTDFTDGKVAHYSTDGHFVEFDPSMPFSLEQVLLHEAVHAVTSKYVASFGDSTALGKELAALFKLAEQHAKKTGADFYGLTNADEFLAEVMTNGDFAQWLDTVPVPLQKSALSRFVRAVARFFGIQKADGATTQAMDVFERIMRAQSDLQAEANQRLSTSKDAAAVADAYGVDTEADGDTVYFGEAEVSLNREDNTYIVSSDNEFTPDHRAAVAWAENNGFTSEFSKSPSANLTPVEAALRDALEATGDMGAAKDMAYEALRRQGVAVKWQEVVDAAKKMGRGTRASKVGQGRAGKDPVVLTEEDAARAALARIMEKGVTSPDDLRDLLRVPGYSKWAKSTIAGDMAGAKALRGELDAAFPGNDWKGPTLNEQGIIFIYPDWNGLTEDNLKTLTDLADKYDAPIALRGGAVYPGSAIDTKLSGYGVERYNGLQERADRTPGVMFGMIRPAGGITATTPLFSRDTESPRTPVATIRAAITKAYGNLLDKLESKGLGLR